MMAREVAKMLQRLKALGMKVRSSNSTASRRDEQLLPCTQYWYPAYSCIYRFSKGTL